MTVTSLPTLETTTAGPRPAPPMVRVVWNLPLAIGSLLVIAILTVSVYLWHNHQVRRLSNALLSRAEQLESDGALADATDYVRRFIRLRRGSREAAAAQIRLAKLIDKGLGEIEKAAGADISSAIGAYYRGLGVANPAETIELRRRLVELLIETRRFVDAERESRELLAFDANDSAARRAYAIALAAQIHRGELAGERHESVSVGSELARALELNPHDRRLSSLLARLYRDEPAMLSAAQRADAPGAAERAARANAIIDELVRGRPEDPEAWLTRHEYRLSYKLAGAEEDLRAALRAAPDSLSARLAAAAFVKQQATPEQRAEAIEHYEHILGKLDPRLETAWMGLADHHLAEGDSNAAIETCQRGLEQLGPDHFGLNGRLARSLLRAGKLDDAERRLKKLDDAVTATSFGRPATRRARELERDMIRASLWFERGRAQNNSTLVRQSAELLERLASGAAGKSADTWGLLAEAHRELRHWEPAANAYDKSFSLDATRLDRRHLAASCWLMAGQASQAARRFEELAATASGKENVELWIALATARLRHQASLDPLQRDWATFETALARASQLSRAAGVAEHWRIPLLRAERFLDVENRASIVGGGVDAELARQQRRRELQESLVAIEQAYPDNAELHERLIMIHRKLGDDAAATRTLERFEKLAQGTSAAILARARLLLDRGQFADAEQTLEEGLGRLPREAHVELRRELVRIAYAAGDAATARSRLLDLHRERIADPDTMFQLAELAFHDRDLAEARQWEDRLRECEGDNGILWRFVRARRLIDESTSDVDPRLGDVERLIETLRVARPSWAAPHVLEGFLAERRGYPQEAIAAYRRAMDGGDRRPLVLQRLVQLLKDDLPEAERVLALLRGRGAGVGDLAQLRIDLARQRGDHDQALALARAEAARRPRDAAAQLWLGRLLLERYDPESPRAEVERAEAHQAFAKAVELEGSSAEAWSGLFLFCLKTRQTDEARKVLSGIDQLANIGPGRRAEMRAQGLQLLGDRTAAQSAYLDALRFEPGNADLHLRFATFVQESNSPLAVQHLRESLRLNPRLDPARRLLAALLARGGGEQEWKQADELLQSHGDRPADVATLRLQANLLAQRPGAANVKRAREILERLVESPASEPVDRLLLARVHEMEGRLDAATGQYLSLVAHREPSPEHLLEFCEFLARREQWHELTSWLDKHAKISATSVAALRLRVRALAGLKQFDHIDPVLQAFHNQLEPTLADPLARGRLLAALGDMAGAAGLDADAEKWHRQAFAISHEHFAGLALSLSRQMRRLEALDICLEAAKTDRSPKPAMVACELLLQGRPTSDEFGKAETLIVENLERHPADVVLLASAANVRMFQGRYDESEALLDKALQTDPRNVVALNNLAMLQAERPGAATKAVETIDRAIDLAGPHPALLDTKAVALLRLGKAADALPLLEEAAKAVVPDPRATFHLAWACLQLGQTDKARKHLDRATREGLDRQPLTESDRQMLAKLTEDSRQ
ncbi:MAG: tetratricopeptide repeat protein [Pirellulales bacterium]